MSQTQAKKRKGEKQKKEKKIHTYYEIKDGKLVRNLRKCPRCDAFMAQHKERERSACGSCGYTDYAST